MAIFTLVEMLRVSLYVAPIFELVVPLRHAEWRSGTGFSETSFPQARRISSFFRFRLQAIQTRNLDLFLSNHRHPTMTGLDAFRVHSE